MKTLPRILVLGLFLLTFPLQAQTLSQFKPVEGGKVERLEALEKYLKTVSSAMNQLRKKVSKSSGPEFRKLKSRLDKLERSKKSDSSCCQLVTKHNLPKMADETKTASRKIKDLEKKTDKHQAEDFLKLQAEVRVLQSSVEDLKKIVLKSLKKGP